jgi:hypothetical protein
MKSTRHTTRFGFALAFVLVLILALSAMVVVMLERQSAQSLTYKRQTDSYAMHHTTAGFSEAIEAWLRNNGQTPLRRMIGTGGHAFDISMSGGLPVRVSLYEAQGMPLAELSGLPEEQISMGREMLVHLREKYGVDAERYTRTDGPLAISIRSASQEILLAAAEIAMREEGDPEKLVDVMIRARESGNDDDMDITKIVNEADVPPSARPRVASLFVTETTLWRGTAELVEPSGSFEDPVVYEFWANIRSGSKSSRDTGSLLQRSTSILRWERMQQPTYR